MARWILSPIIGDGTARVVPGQEATTGPYRPKAADYATAWTALVPEVADAQWCVVRATEGDLAAAEADTELVVFPQLDPDHVLTLAQRNWLISRLDNRGHPSGWVTAGITVREVIRTIGRWLDNRFDFEWLGTN